MLKIHSISGPSVAALSGLQGRVYLLVIVECGSVMLKANVHQSAKDIRGKGVYLFSGDCTDVSGVEIDTSAELICFSRIFLVSFLRMFPMGTAAIELENGCKHVEMDAPGQCAMRRDLELLKTELENGGNSVRVRLAFCLLMCSVLAGNGDVNLAGDCGFTLKEFDELLEAHLCSCRSTSFYARRLGMSSRKLNSWCRSRFSGKSFYGVLIERLMVEAEYRLLCTEVPIKVIALELGFRSVQHFRTYFVRYRRVSPSRFRLGLACNDELVNLCGLDRGREG
jgi:AraC-like DNA-binding protein